MAAAKKALKTKKKAPAKKAPAKRAKPAKKVAKKVSPIPPNYRSVTPHLIVSPCSAALAFYEKAFGAKVLSSMSDPGGKVMHAEVKIGDSMITLADEMPTMSGQPVRKTPKSAGAVTGGVMLYVKDTDAVFNAAVAAGAHPTTPPADMFWGDRFSQIEDPWGQVWAIATHVRDVSQDEMMAAMAQMAPPAQ